MLHQPAVDVARLAAEVDAHAEDPARVRDEGAGIVFVLNLPQGLFGGAVQLELHDVDEAVGLQHQVDAPL